MRVVPFQSGTAYLVPRLSGRQPGTGYRVYMVVLVPRTAFIWFSKFSKVSNGPSLSRTVPDPGRLLLRESATQAESTAPRIRSTPDSRACRWNRQTLCPRDALPPD